MNRHAKGFTVVELMVTIAVLGVLAAAAFPSMRDYVDKQRLVSQVRAVSNLAQLARSEAIKRSAASQGTALSDIAMTVKPASPWFVGLAAGNAPCTGASDCFIHGNTDTQMVTATECSACTVSSPAAQAVIVFDRRGIVTSNADVDITMASPMGKQLSLSVSRLGRISLCTPSGSVKGFPTC